MKLSREIREFEDRIGHRFARPDLLVQALTHASFAAPARPSNERLEFLGDRVLGLVVATALLRDDPAAAEGTLSPRFNALVRLETCAEIAREIGLGEVLRLGRSEAITGGRRKEALLGDAMEAVIAAVYLDAGFDAAQALVLRLWGGRIAAAEARVSNPKSALQEWTQARGLGLPAYSEVAREGPPHEPVFTIEVRLESGDCARATAPGKRAAEIAAAAALIARLEADA